MEIDSEDGVEEEMKQSDCNIDANYYGDLLCQHLKEPCEWWLERMNRDEYKKRQTEHYQSEGIVSAYWYDWPQIDEDGCLEQFNEMYGLQFNSWDEIPRDDLIYHLRTLLLEYSILSVTGGKMDNEYLVPIDCDYCGEQNIIDSETETFTCEYCEAKNRSLCTYEATGIDVHVDNL